MRPTEPQVFLIARPAVDWAEVARYLEAVGGRSWLDRVRPGGPTAADPDTGPAGRGDGELLVEFMGRLCYRSWEPGLNPNVTKVRTDSDAYLGNILASAHGSVLEHASYSFVFLHVSRVLTHELVRHRAGMGFSQLSQRYVDESDIAFVLPPEIEEGSRAYQIWLGACESTLIAYRELLQEMAGAIGDDGPATMRKKRARQAARAVLPNAAETKIVVTGNARAWRHFVEMRGSGSADVEIRRLAATVLRALQQEAPHIFGDMHLVPQPDGTEVVETAFSKV